MEPLVSLLVCIAVLHIVSELLAKVNVPRVVAQVGTGMVFGLPFIRDVLFTDESMSVLRFLGYIGSILLLYFVGLQLDVRKSVSNLPVSAGISFFNTSMPLVLGMLVCHWFGLSWTVALIVGVCMSVSAAALALDLLEEFGKLRSSLGRLIVEAGAFDDIVETLLVAGVLSIIGAASKTVSLIVADFIIFLAIVLVFRLLFVPWMLRNTVEKEHSPVLFSGALIMTLLLAVLADYLGVGALIGALFGGMITRQVLLKDANHRPWELLEISRDVHAIGFGFLIPFFFLLVGLNSDIMAIWNNFSFSVAITVIAIFGTVVGSAIGYWTVKKHWKEAWLVGWALNAKGDTELVIAQLALSVGLISRDIFSSLIFMAVVSTLISPIVFKRLLRRV